MLDISVSSAAYLEHIPQDMASRTSGAVKRAEKPAGTQQADTGAGTDISVQIDNAEQLLNKVWQSLDRIQQGQLEHDQRQGVKEKNALQGRENST